MAEPQAVEPAGIEPSAPIESGGQIEPIIEEPQAVPRMEAEPEPKSKIFGEFESPYEVKSELDRLRSLEQAISRDRDVQALIEARREAARMAEQEKLSIQSDEQRILENYAEAVGSGNPDKALLTLVREIRSQANRDAQVAVRRELDAVAEPLRAKQQLIENTNWQDLHPLSDEAVWLATELGKLGYSKPDVANFLRRVGVKYSGGGTSGASPRGGKRREAGMGLAAPDTGGTAHMSDKQWDRAVDEYWKRAGY